MSVALQALPELVADLTAGTLRIVGLALAAGVVTALAAIAYRWYARDRLPTAEGVLIGAATIAVYLNTTAALGQAIGGQTGVLRPNAAIVNTLTFLLGGVVADGGRRAGDRVGRSLAALTGGRELTGDVGRLVGAVGRMTTVTLPEEIEDLEAYDPVAPGIKEQLAGRTLLFSRRGSNEALKDALIERLKDEYGVGHVGVEMTPQGGIEYLAVGRRAAGIGSTIPPGTAVTAVRADPATAASPGDLVQVWRAGDADTERVATGELRATDGDVATVAADEPEAEAIDPEATHRLVTLPGDVRADREFAGLLRGADETMAAVTLAPESGLVGLAVGAIDATVVGVRGAAGDMEPLPPRERTLAAGDTLYAMARPERLRQLEAAAGAGPPAEPS